MTTSADTRYITNPYYNYERDSNLPSLVYNVEEANAIKQPIITQELDSCYKNRYVKTSRGIPDASDKTIYTGLGGIAYAYLRLAKHYQQQQQSASSGNTSMGKNENNDGDGDDNNNNKSSSFYFRRARDLAVLCLEDVDFRKVDPSVSFYCGAPGSLAIGCVACAFLGEKSSSEKFWKELIQIHEKALQSDEDELLFGRAGYLYSLLFVKSQLEKNAYFGYNPIQNKSETTNLDQVLKRVAESIIASGRERSQRDGYDQKYGWPLMFYFGGEPYLGAAHGVVGILTMLYKCWHVLSINDRGLISQTSKRLCQELFPNGNLPVVVNDRNDDLVHWCHGCSGLVALVAAAMTVEGDPSGTMRSVGLMAGDHIWKHGVLLKGNGLCHGLVGNAYAFLSLYRLTGDRDHLQRAKAFAKLLANNDVQNLMLQHPDPQRDVVGIPDSPQSLMEGSAGVLCFLLDLEQPETSAFPGWEL